ncbi:MAG TPA: hypothetical protein VF731_09265 [Solirubrobacterales bacterium]
MRRGALLPFLKSSIALAALAALAALLAIAPLAGATGSREVAKEAPNEALGKTVLTTMGGRTLYSLSVEKHGRFVCTGSCLRDWHPLTVRAGTKPTGPVKVGTVKRPDGRTQVTYKGRPLYSFAGDTRSGQANGEGIKDVGTWHAAVVPSAPSSEPQPEPSPTPNPYPGSPY